jgi:hypothetical protein
MNLLLEALGECKRLCDWDGLCRTCPHTEADWELKDKEEEDEG